MALLRTHTLQAQSAEERFQDLFITAGYSTAFGAALGAAMLAFTPEPSRQLRYIAMGASLGFIGGSIMGTYIIFTPMLSYEQDSKYNDVVAQDDRRSAFDFNRQYHPELLTKNVEKNKVFSIAPYIDAKNKHLSGLEINYTLATN